MKKILFFLIITTSISLFAQTPLILNVNPTHSTYNVLYPANFNPDEPDLQPDLFTITITGVAPSNAVLFCRMIWEDESAEITLTPNIPGQFPTSLNSTEIINYDPNGFSVEQDFDDFLERIEDLIIDTGRMPDGSYIFNIGIYEEGHEGDIAYQLSEPVTVVVVIRSPISISLITPGNPIGLGVTNISEPYPNFVWFSNLTDYTIKIFELDEMYETIDDIEMLEPYFVEKNIGRTSFFYPPSAPEFVYGRTYAWQVSAKVVSPIMSAESVYKSTMYLFRLSDSSAEEMSLQILINFLNQLDIEGVDEVIKLLETGYTIDNLIWQGKEIPFEDLMEILEDISSGKIEPKKLTVE